VLAKNFDLQAKYKMGCGSTNHGGGFTSPNDEKEVYNFKNTKTIILARNPKAS